MLDLQFKKIFLCNAFLIEFLITAKNRQAIISQSMHMNAGIFYAGKTVILTLKTYIKVFKLYNFGCL